VIAPFAALLELLERPAAAPDAQWSELEAVVAGAFGRRLAAAAARGQLQIR
jgi:hypothetical protein